MSEDKKGTEQLRVRFPPHLLWFLEKRIKVSYTLNVCE